MAKRLKLSRKKNYAQLNIFVNDKSNNSGEKADSESDSSLESFRRLLLQHLPTFDGNWENFPELPQTQRLRSYSKIEGVADECDQLTDKINNEVFKSNDVEMKDPNSESVADCNSIIEQCPLCPFRFPIYWNQTQIQTHVNEHIDE